MPRKRLSSRRNNFNHDDDNNICSVLRVAEPGDIAWTKINGSSWWPVQVVNEENVTNKPKKKAEGEVLVRLYGTYEHFYLDATKSCSEFANILKIENSIRREAFQKALEKDLSQMKSGRKSKRKASGQTGTVSDAPKNKRQKPSEALKDEKGMQLVVEANQETLTLAPPESHSDKSVERSTEKRKDEALIQKKRKRDEVTNSTSETETGGQDNARKTKISKKSSVLSHNDRRGRKQKLKMMGKAKTGSEKNAKLKSPISDHKLKINSNKGSENSKSCNCSGKSVDKHAKKKTKGKASREKKTKRNKGKNPEDNEAFEDGIEEGSDSDKVKVGEKVTRSTLRATIAGQDEERKTKMSKKSSYRTSNHIGDRKLKFKLGKKGKRWMRKIWNQRPQPRGVSVLSYVPFYIPFLCQLGNHSGKSVEKIEARNRDKASREKKAKRGELKKPKLDEASTSKIEWGCNLGKAKAGEAAKRTSKAKTARQDRSRKSKISEKSSDEASDRIGNTKNGSKENPKPKNPISPGKHPGSSVQKIIHRKTKSDEVKEPKEAKVSKDNTKEGSEMTHAKVGRVTNRTSKVENARQDESKKTKSSSGKSSDQASNGTGKEKTGSKENMLPKSPTSVKLASLEESFDSSVRKLRVMRNLGLIPPQGSPFGRKES